MNDNLLKNTKWPIFIESKGFVHNINEYYSLYHTPQSDVDKARETYIKFLANMGMDEESAHKASFNAQQKYPIKLIKNFNPKAYIDCVCDGWELRYHSSYLQLINLNNTSQTISIPRYGGKFTLFLNNIGVYKGKIEIKKDEEMLQEAVKKCLKWLRKTKQREINHECH